LTKVKPKPATAATAASPGDAQQQLVAARRLAKISRYFDVARGFGRVVGRAGLDRGDGCTCIMTGGGPGIMEAQSGTCASRSSRSAAPARA
jgi:predicted Rossmann-fold nucleotide-binding protein